MSNHLAFVFPGQGSQAVGMLAELAASDPIVADTFAEVSEAVGRDLWKLTSEGPAEELDQTQNTQPAMLAAGVSIWRCWNNRGGAAPELMAGHSLGEYSALVCAGALELADAARLVAERARLMQQAVPLGSGAMAAILGLKDEQVRQLCADHAGDDVLEPVNFNAPGQVVIAGDRVAVERALPAAKAAGAKRAQLLSVSVPSHCSLMRPAAEQLRAALAEATLVMPSIPVMHNVSVGPAEDPEQLRALLAEQLYQPVRWVETICTLGDRGIRRMIECGPGKVLTSLAKRIDKRCVTSPINDVDSLESAIEEVRASE